MSDQIEQIRAEVRRLSERLDRVERALRTDAERHEPGDETRQRQEEEKDERDVSPASAAAREASSPADRGEAADEPVWEMVGEPARAVDSQTKSIRIERLLGLRAFALFGALIVISGVALFLKLAWDRGWFGQLPDAGKCGLGAAFGFALLGLGEIALRRIDARASAGLSAAGLGALYATAYAAFSPFALVSRPAALALLAGTAALGIGVSVRGRLAFVGAVSLIGGFFAPIVLGAGEPPPPVFMPSYVTALLFVGLILSAALGGGFAVMRSLAWWGTVLLGGGWALSDGVNHPFVLLPFLAVVWGAVHGEMLIASRRGRLVSPSIFGGADTTSVRARARPLASSLSTSVWAVGLGVLVIRASAQPGLDWMAPAAGFAAAGHLALTLLGGVDSLRRTPRTDAQRLGATLAAQAGALLIVAVALALTNWLETVSFFALGLSAVFAGRWLRLRALDVYGLVALTYASLHMLTIEWWRAGAAATGIDFAGLFLSRWTLLVVAGGAAWLAAGALLLRHAGARWRSAAAVVAGVGAAHLFASLLHERVEASSLAWAWVGLSAVVALARPAAAALRLELTALLGLAAAMFPWVVAHLQPGWFASLAPIGAHPGLILALVAAGVCYAICWRINARRTEKTIPTPEAVIGFAGATVLALAATSLETARGAELLTGDQTVRRAAVSIWWGLFSAPMLAIGFRLRIEAVRLAALGLLAAGAVKAVIFDLAAVPAAWRVGSFLALGLLMLAVAVLYARVARSG